MKLVNCFILISFILFIASLPIDVHALRMSNSQYIIQSDINSFGGKSTGASNKITFTGGQTAPGLYSGTNYKVRAGFQYMYSLIPFTFSISTTQINFGTLVPGEPVSRDNTLTVSNGSTSGYQVTAQEDHPLRISSTTTDIPDTTCDAGACSQTLAAAWSSPLTYGFGYRCNNVTGSDCSTSFSTSTFYKQFPNSEAGESTQVVMSSTNVARKKQGKIIYKVNISSSQASGIYQNIIKYIATPSI